MQYVAEPATVRLYYRGNKYEVPVDFATRLHPGGKAILMRYKDSDITKDFEKTSHSVDAVVMMSEWRVGGNDFDEVSKPCAVEVESQPEDKREAQKSKTWNRLAIAFGLASIMAAVQVRKH